MSRTAHELEKIGPHLVGLKIKPEVAILRMVGLFDRPVEEDEIAALRAEPPVLALTDVLAGVGGRAPDAPGAG